MIGAGPLENLVREFGDQAMDRAGGGGEPTTARGSCIRWLWNEPIRARIDRTLAEHGQALM
jgi:hypothetical protein